MTKVTARQRAEGQAGDPAVCQRCGAHFSARRRTAKWCSSRCAKAKHPAICEMCGQSFMGWSPGVRFCSVVCKGQHHAGRWSPILNSYEERDCGFGSPCWIYTRRKPKPPYGYFQIQLPDGSQPPAHRYFYEQLVGPVAPELHIDHLCRNPSCVNPAHLEPVTPRENTMRGIGPSAVNAQKTYCKRGHEFTAENTYVYPSGNRSCRTCGNARDRARRAARKVGQ